MGRSSIGDLCIIHAEACRTESSKDNGALRHAFFGRLSANLVAKRHGNFQTHHHFWFVVAHAVPCQSSPHIALERRFGEAQHSQNVMMVQPSFQAVVILSAAAANSLKIVIRAE